MIWSSVEEQLPRAGMEVLAVRDPAPVNKYGYVMIRPWIESAYFEDGKWVSAAPGKKELKDVKWWTLVDLPYNDKFANSRN